MEHTTERSFGFLHINERSGKPRRTGVTEIRGPYYAPLGKRALPDSVVKAVRHLEHISVRELVLHLV